ncbi:DUF5107 domain-containing protein [Streptomyces sp. HSW2009]|uniref:DUF5107 domain-containing protein n=1 Tax=Streptomyces sp. HSW2009 TaxID=3142890 RepID=UPI0032EC7F86
MVTSVRRTTLTLPAAPLGPENPLPALRPLDEVHQIDDRTRAGLPDQMARQVAYEPLRSILPTRLRDAYTRERVTTELDAIVIENDRLRATVLPGLGGRVASLFHKPTGRELLYRNPVFQPADFALNGAWFSGGIEWNIGATGHTTLSCAPVYAARVPAPDGSGGEMLRLWEWERLRDLPFQVDLWLPDGSDFLYVGVRVRNPHPHPAAVYWWSNIAVPEDARTRVIAPAEAAYHFGYERTLRRVPVPTWQGVDHSYPLRGDSAADFFYDLPAGARRWIAALDGTGHGLVHTSTDLLRGRKLFRWGAGAGGRRWQEWLTEPGTGGYAEIQAGLARTQLEHVRLGAEEEFSWLEAYGPLSADAVTVHGDHWAAARGAVAEALAAALPRDRVDAAYRTWLPSADAEPGEVLAEGSGWGALELERAGYELPGTPFAPASLGAPQQPWRELLRTGALPTPQPTRPPGTSLVSRPWRELLETADADVLVDPHLKYHLGVAQWHEGDRSQAVRSWERAIEISDWWPVLRCLAVADQTDGHVNRAADRWLAAFRGAVGEWRAAAGTEGVAAAPGGVPGLDGAPGLDAVPGPDAASGLDAVPGPDVQVADVQAADGQTAAEWRSALAGLARETVAALLAVERAAEAHEVLAALPDQVRARGRFALLEARVLLAAGDAAAARALFDRGFEVADLREGEETLSETWYAIAEGLIAAEPGAKGLDPAALRARARTDHPLPERYEFRMRPS